MAKTDASALFDAVVDMPFDMMTELKRALAQSKEKTDGE